MAILVHEDSMVHPNGVRTMFPTKAPYVAGTVRVFVNGQLIDENNVDGFHEAGHSMIRMAVPPRTKDQLKFQYRPL